MCNTAIIGSQFAESMEKVLYMRAMKGTKLAQQQQRNSVQNFVPRIMCVKCVDNGEKRCYKYIVLRAQQKKQTHKRLIAMRKVTIQMIAERAGVSRGTVDRVLHDRPSVTPEIRERVKRLAKQLGYGEPDDGTPRMRARIGVFLPGSDWFSADLKREWLNGVHDAQKIIEPLGYEVGVIECETDLPNELDEQLERFRSDGIDGAVISARNTPAAQRIIRRLTEQHIPVITFSSDLPESGRTCFIGEDPYRSGRVAADLITKYIRPGDEILIVAGNLEIDAHAQRVSGFRDKCLESGIGQNRLHIVQSFNEYVLTGERVSEQLKCNDRIRAVYMATESVAACAEAVQLCHRKSSVMIVGNDLTAVTKRLLKADKIDFIIEQDLYRQGYQPIIQLKEILEDPAKPVKPVMLTEISVINAENMR